ncbi:MAG: hypothetical protein J7M27_06545 [Candidatus Latescibacteria bacterium]|nr:hypothetical protein [Candidatus Latescibacterota bacterium]
MDDHENTLLFFEDYYLNRRENLSRHLGQPQLAPEATIENPSMSLSFAYPSVFRLEDGSSICLHQAYGKDERWYALLRESNDGIYWDIPNLTSRIKLKDRVYPNQILPSEKDGEWGIWFKDERASDHAPRFRGFFVWHIGPNQLETRLLASSDGRVWRAAEGIEWQAQPLAPDPPASAFWNPVRDCYVLTVRPMNSDRRIAVVETKDWKHFSDPELALEPDALDSPCAQLYGMPVIPYGGVFVGLLWLFHPSPDERGDHKYLNGKVDCQLTFSRNGWHFQRTLRESFIANSSPGEYGAGCIYPSSIVVDRDDGIRIYSSASKVEHGILTHGAGAILLHTLRLDGFVYLQSQGGAGRLGTRPLYWQSGEARINIQAPDGQARVQVTDKDGQALPGYTFDDCNLFSGDDRFWIPRWKDGKNLSALAGKAIRLEIEMLNGRIYAIRGDFIPMVALQVKRFEQDGQAPAFRPGF